METYVGTVAATAGTYAGSVVVAYAAGGGGERTYDDTVYNDACVDT